MALAIAADWNTDRIIEEINVRRVACIQALLQTSELENYLQEKFDVFALSGVRREFLKRDLMTLTNDPLDLGHYATAIRQAKEAGCAPDQTITQQLIAREIENVIRKYIS